MEIIMKTTNKTDNFLKAIKKYSEKERQQIREEIAVIKEEELKKAEAKGKADADKYIAKQLSEAKSKSTSDYAVKNLEAQSALFKRRDGMVNQVFSKATDKLKEFTFSPEYKEKLISYAKEIAEIFKDNSCVIYLNKEDMKYSDDIKSVFTSEVKIESDVTIRIGGIRGFCESMKLVADNTLDSKLEDQKSWFVENANLKVM